MKKLLAYLSSTVLMAVLLFIIAVSVALATFLENDYGSHAARKLIYDAFWFKSLLGLALVNIIAVAVERKLYRKQKISIFIFHLAFAVIIIGAGITRFFGQEGIMHIREGATSDTWYSSNTYVGLLVRDKETSTSGNYPVLFSYVSENIFRKKVTLHGQRVKFRLQEYIHKAERIIVPDDEGRPLVQLITTRNDLRQDIILEEGQRIETDQFILTFKQADERVPDSGQVFIFLKDTTLFMTAPFPVYTISMEQPGSDTLEPREIHPFRKGVVYNIGGTPFLLRNVEALGKVDAQPVPFDTKNAVEALKFNVSFDGISKQLTVIGDDQSVGKFSFVEINGIEIGANYGVIKRRLPFELTLNDFILLRYPGSESPSWYESRLLVTDLHQKKDFNYNVYMNHVLKYRGYRFYQSYFDLDERGTILTVNRDSAGIMVTYAGYVLMVLGMVLSLFNKNSRFITLVTTPTKSIKTAALAALIGILSFSASSVRADSPSQLPLIDQQHAADFGHILVQDNGGRIEPINTLASEILRKVARKENYHGQNAEQVLLGMIVYPEIWQHEAMIRINHHDLQKIVGVNKGYAAYTDFFTNDSFRAYKLQEYIQSIYHKKPTERTKLDNEIIRVDERLNICYLVYTGALLKLFPAKDDTSHTWYAQTFTENVFSHEDSVFVKNVLSYYSQEVKEAIKSGNWAGPNEVLKYIKTFQEQYGMYVIPSGIKVKTEVLYNNINLFSRIGKIYLLAGILLLVIQFIYIFMPAINLRWLYLPLTIIIFIVFSLHTAGLGIRWYIAGHAPLSNGYEALIYVAWSTVLAGILFSRKAGFALGSTAVLASLILQIAHLSWMDPQLTNLVPVLKSYWLVLHVAVITASYGFLALGAFIAGINLLLMIVQNRHNFETIEHQVEQVHKVIETTLIAGLYLLAIGTFLGAVWANESWGRYWSWDPKESWALITILVYVFILHLRLVPGLKRRVTFTILALAGFYSVIMTYFGVNYYLSGMHSYAQGDPVSLPPAVYISIIIVVLLSCGAGVKQYWIKKATSN